MEWIRCSDRMPNTYNYVLVLANNQGTGEPKPMSIARFEGQANWNFINHMKPMPNYGAWMDIEYNMDGDDITHWMPLPLPPKEE